VPDHAVPDDEPALAGADVGRVLLNAGDQVQVRTEWRRFRVFGHSLKVREVG